MSALKIKNYLADERGIALLLTLVVLVLMVAVIVEFDYGAKVDLMTAANFRDDVRATYLAKSGVTAARAVLKDDAKNSPGYDGPDEFWAQLLSLPVGEGVVSGEITDEGGKIDVNRLGVKDTSVSGDTKEMLKRLLGVLEIESGQIDPIVEAIKHWVDPASLDCDEDSYYQRLDPPYHCKKAPMDTLSELLLVKGVTPEIYRKVRPYLTTVSMLTNPININTAGLPVLQALDGNNIDHDTAICIQNGRPYEMINNATWVGCPTDCLANPSCRRKVGVKSSYFTVKSHGIMHDTEKIATAMIFREGTKTKLVSWQIE
ncbi:MAG: type II secretion system minor pseudopilin GspK [Nitrospirae bacterium]|nr:type II secretion system minor pseudopilin GspK [Nitrospirota bacterium]